MRRSVLFTMVCAAAALGCNSEEVLTITPNPNSYQITAPLTDVTVGQDSLLSLFDYGVRVVRNGTDTVPGPDEDDEPIPRLSYFLDDISIAYVDYNNDGQFGFIRGVKPGTTNLRVVGYGDEINFPITVIARPATDYFLRVLHRPNGELIPAAERSDTGTFWALPSHEENARLEGLILAGTDTLYCNYCPVNEDDPRVQRIVHFRVLDPTKATVSNAGDPTKQRDEQDDNLDDTDEAGWLTLLDTTSTPVQVAMDVPGDGVTVTASLKFALRPIDSLRIMPDSLDVPAEDVDDIGTERVAYDGNSTVGITVASGNTNFVARAEYRSFYFELPISPDGPLDADDYEILTILPYGDVDEFRPFLPIITWESALESYLTINAAGAIVAPCAFVDGGSCEAPTSRSSGGGLSGSQRAQQARDSLVMQCVDNGRRLPGTLTNGQPVGPPIQFGGDGILSFPTCPLVGTAPGPNIPMPGAFCTSANSADLSATCSIWIRATTIDPATGVTLTDHYRIEVRRD